MYIYLFNNNNNNKKIYIYNNNINLVYNASSRTQLLHSDIILFANGLPLACELKCYNANL